MAEGTYEYECMRAELLGVEKPDYNDFLKRQKEQLAKEVEEEQVETECLTVNRPIVTFLLTQTLLHRLECGEHQRHHGRHFKSIGWIEHDFGVHAKTDQPI